jgi:hypothetical protein
VFLMSLLILLVTHLQSEGCVAVEAVEINVFLAKFESSFFSVSAIIMVLLLYALHSRVHLFD